MHRYLTSSTVTNCLLKCTVLCVMHCPVCANRYLTSSTFCLAGMGLPDDSQMVQMLLVLSTVVSFVLGGFISWAWLAVPKA